MTKHVSNDEAIDEKAHLNIKKTVLVFIQFLSSHMSHVMRKTNFVCAKTKVQISCAVKAQLISVFVFATKIHSLYILNP